MLPDGGVRVMEHPVSWFLGFAEVGHENL